MGRQWVSVEAQVWFCPWWPQFCDHLLTQLLHRDLRCLWRYQQIVQENSVWGKIPDNSTWESSILLLCYRMRGNILPLVHQQKIKSGKSFEQESTWGVIVLPAPVFNPPWPSSGWAGGADSALHLTCCSSHPLPSPVALAVGPNLQLSSLGWGCWNVDLFLAAETLEGERETCLKYCEHAYKLVILTISFFGNKIERSKEVSSLIQLL